MSAARAFAPTATFESASVKASPARPPMRVFLKPVVTFKPALCPTAVLKLSVAVVKFCKLKAL